MNMEPDTNIDPEEVISSPVAQKQQRPSYLDIGLPVPLSETFNEAVIRKLESDFDIAAAEESRQRCNNNNNNQHNGRPFHHADDDDDDDAGEQIKTYLRIRPYMKSNPNEVDLLQIKDDRTVIASCDAAGIRVKRINKKMSFNFTKVMDDTYTQERVYEEAVSPLLDRFDAGENCLILSYGATNSGKTYTMRGSATKYGIIPRTLYSIFARYQDRIYQGGEVQPFRHESTRSLQDGQKKEISDKKKSLIESANDTVEMKHRAVRYSTLAASSQLNQSKAHNIRTSDGSSHCSPVQYVGAPTPNVNESMVEGTVFGMWVSFVELYNEKCYDLFSHGRRTEVKIVSEKGGYAYFKDLTELPVFSEEEAFALYVAGHKKLEISATQVNQTSSRSHSFFTIRVVELGKTSQTVFPVTAQRMTFCDLAGCERVNQTENTGGQLRESANINQSLSSLLKVIRMIRDKQSQGQMRDFKDKIPFRDSKLTRIFQGYFSNSAHITMIVNVNPSPKMADSSMQTLMNSAIASHVVTFRPRPPPASQHASLLHDSTKSIFSNSFLHRSLELEDVPEEQTEDDESDENNPPPETVVPTRIMPPPVGVLNQQNRIITTTASMVNVQINKPTNNLNPRHAVTSKSTLAARKPDTTTFNDFKVPKAKPIKVMEVVKNAQNEKLRAAEEADALRRENASLREELAASVAYFQTQIFQRDATIAELTQKIKTVEAETRERILATVTPLINDTRNMDQKELAYSDQRCKELRTRIAKLEKKEIALSTPTPCPLSRDAAIQVIPEVIPEVD